MLPTGQTCGPFYSNSYPIQSQIVIISSKDGACSITSEESSLIDVGVDNPWGNIDVNDIPMEVVSDPIASDNEVIISTDK